MNTSISYSAFLSEYPNGEHSTVARKRLRQIRGLDTNWRRLRQGMSVYEVDRLIGPLSGFGIDVIKRSKDASDSGRATQPPAAELFYSDAFCELTFSAGGDLLKWARK